LFGLPNHALPPGKPMEIFGPLREGPDD